MKSVLTSPILSSARGLYLSGVMAAALLLSACGGNDSSPFINGNSTSTQNNNSTSTQNNVNGVAATGAPLANVPYTVRSVSDPNHIVAEGKVGNDAHFSLELDSEDAPYLIEVTDTGVFPSVIYANLLFASDFSADKSAKLNVTPLSTIVTKTVLKESNFSTKTAEEQFQLRNDVAEAVKQAIDPLLQQAGVADVTSGHDLLTKVFTPISDPLDKVLDSIKVDCTADSSCSIVPLSDEAKIRTGALTIDTTSLETVRQSVDTVKTALNANKDTMFKVAPVVVVLSADSSWGTPSDAWAGYSGKIAIYNFTDMPIDGGSELYFESQKLKADGFWNVTFSASDGKYLLTLPDWASINPLKEGEAPQSYTLGFNGQGLVGEADDLSACNINGRKCIVLLDDGIFKLDKNDSSVVARSWTNFLATVKQDTVTPSEVPPLTPPVSDGRKEIENIPVKPESGSTSTSAAEVVVTSTGSWDSGFNGELLLTNTGTQDWTSWSVTFPMPTGVTAITSWGNYKLTTSENIVTFENESWNGNVGPGKTLKLGFGGGGILSSTSSIASCSISVNGETASTCDAKVSSSTPAVTEPAPSPETHPATFTPPAPPPNTSTSPAEAKVSASVHAVQTKRVFVGYYPSWSDNWFDHKKWDGAEKTDDEILATSKLAKVPGTYTHIVAAFAQPNFSYSTANNFDKNSWSGTGLNFNAGPQDIKRAIDVLHARNIKILLAVGGATYNAWEALAAEGSNGGTITTALKQVLIDVGFDGLDVDYEVEGTNTDEYKGAVNAMRKAVDLANATDSGSRILAVAGWSTGADCTGAATSPATTCAGKASYWGGKAGGERLVFSDEAMAAKIDMVNIMSYDARFEHYDGVTAWQFYRDLFPSTTIVSIGLETAPEGWAGGMLVVNDEDALCTGSTILQDQYSTVVNKPYSVDRYASAATEQRAHSNPRDGAMLWQVLKTATASCGTAKVASPGTIAKKISELYGLPSDDRADWQ